jgi:hypothetical protein
MPGRNQPRSRRGRSAIARTAMNTNSTNGLGINNGGGMKKGGAHPSATGFMRSKPWQISVSARKKMFFNMNKINNNTNIGSVVDEEPHVGEIGPSSEDSPFDTNNFYPGVNLPGFDYGNVSGAGLHLGYECVSDTIIDWVYGNGQNGVKSIRLPIAPQYIFETGPGGDDGWKLSTAFTGSVYIKPPNSPDGGIATKCTTANGSPYYNKDWSSFLPDYMAALKHTTDQGIFTILDVHQDKLHLCALTFPALSSLEFKNMWVTIARYVIEQEELKHKYVMFELFNEPVDSGCTQTTSDVWNNDYVIPTIQAIRDLEKKMGSCQHVILATTYGDYSGVHSWKGSGKLKDLAIALNKNNFKADNNVLIAGHQYCDITYAGVGLEGCDTDKFSGDKQKEWLDYVDSTLSTYDLKWFMTEGNITCNTTNNCENTNLWTDWLTSLKESKTCVGFTVWFISSYNASANSMGVPDGIITNPTDEQKNLVDYWNVYSNIYPKRTGKLADVDTLMYDFTKWSKMS